MNQLLFEPRSQDGVPRIHKDVCPTLNTMRGGNENLVYAKETRWKEKQLLED